VIRAFNRAAGCRVAEDSCLLPRRSTVQPDAALPDCGRDAAAVEQLEKQLLSDRKTLRADCEEKKEKVGNSSK
jgi:hypothetical protein